VGHTRIVSLDIDLPYLSPEKSRHGKPRLYVRKNGRRIQLKSQPGTPTFAREYAEAVETLSALRRSPAKSAQALPAHNTLGWLAGRYFGSSEFQALDPTMQRRRRAVIEECLRERLNEGAPEIFRDCPLLVVGPEHIKRLRDLKVGKPGAANNRRKYLSSMFGWAVEDRKIGSNPCRDVRRVKYASEGYHTWTVAEVREYQQRHPVGTMARLALELLLLSGGRRGDVVRFGRQMIEDGCIRYVPNKTRYTRREPVFKPILPRLADVIARSPTGDLAFLVTSFGKPFTAGWFGNKMREWCDLAGLSHCTAHGLKKAGATIAAEEGATEYQMMALFDWSTPAQAAVYIRRARRKKMAQASIALLGTGTE
jgi:integrase